MTIYDYDSEKQESTAPSNGSSSSGNGGNDGIGGVTNSGGKTGGSKERRKVDFQQSMKVVLIPTRHEYREAGLNKELWWTASEFKYFQQLSTSEILLMAKQEKIEDLRAARRKLYQPALMEESRYDYIQNYCELEMGRLSPMSKSIISATNSGTHNANNHGTSNSINIGNSSPRKLVKAPVLRVADDSDSDDGKGRMVQPSSRKGLGLYPVSSLQNLSVVGGSSLESTIDTNPTNVNYLPGLVCNAGHMCESDDTDPLLFIESDCLSLCVPLDDDFDVEFDKSNPFLRNNKLAQLMHMYVPSPLSAVVCFITTLFLMIIVLMSSHVALAVETQR
jgi:hypothetical protein